MISMLYYLIVFLPIALEAFPISSSGHVFLCIQFFKHCSFYPTLVAFVENADHIIHGPIALMLLCFFYKRWIFFVLHMRRCRSILMQLIFFVSITTAITAVGYFFLQAIKSTIFSLYYGYAITSLLLFSLYFCPQRNTAKINLLSACLIGIAQAISLLPGISRFGCTFVTAQWLGFSLRRAFEISFLIEFPISVAGFMKGVWSYHVMGGIYNLLQLKFVCTMLVASCFGLYGFCIVYLIVLKNRLALFGYYTILLTMLSFIVQ